MRSGKQRHTAYIYIMLTILPQGFAPEIEFKNCLLIHIYPFSIPILLFLCLKLTSHVLNLSPASHILDLTLGFHICKMGIITLCHGPAAMCDQMG